MAASTKKGRKGSNASYLQPTKASATKSASKKKTTKKNSIGVKKLNDLDLTEIDNDGTHYNPEVNLDDTQPPSEARSNYRHKFFNAELEKKTAELQAQFEELYEELEEQREQVD